MSQKFLETETLDIHAGGRDLIFPHHENEIAQAEALTGKPFARYWIHHGLLTINGQKMSKSLGNFVTIQDFLAKYKDADLLKLFFLSAHYSHPTDYSENKIAEAKKQRKSFDAFFERASLVAEGKTRPVFSDKEKVAVDRLCAKFEQVMEDDFNTPQALAVLFELMDFASAREGVYAYARSRLEVFFGVLGLEVKMPLELSKEVLEKEQQRQQAKKDNNFSEADRIREEMKVRLKVLPSDTPFGVIFTRISDEG
jgi:cysteinyl-tRNA synthetase